MTLNLSLRRDFSWTFIVADVKTAILGADFLAHFNLLVDVKKQRLVDSQTSLAVTGVCKRPSLHSVSPVAHLDFPDGDLSKQYADLINEFADLVGSSSVDEIPRSTTVAHHITTTGPPVFERPRRLCGERLAAAKQEFNTLLAQGVIRPSSSQWASPLHLVAKKSGGWRATGDYRRLNACTTPDRYPLPVIEDLLQDCNGASVFSAIDLRRAYYQIPVAQEDIQKTAVTTPFGLFEFLGMPMGLCNASQTFQRYMHSLLRDLPFVRCYLDDLLVLSVSHEEHLAHLRRLFQALREANLGVNLEKCCFGKSKIVFLGFVISSEGYEPPAAKVQAIKDFPRPETPAQLRRFLGMFNFYRRCIPGASRLQAPLSELLKGAPKGNKAKLVWSPEADQAFAVCKLSVARACRPAFLVDEAPLVLSTDASSSAIGAALEQLEGDSWRPIGFFSRKLSETEARYSTYDRELLAIFAAVKYFRRILEGRKFSIKTDHRPLTFATAQRSDKASPRQQRQLDFILQFSTDIIHVKGEDNVVADALSRTCTVSMPTLLDAARIADAQADDDELPHLKDSALKLQPLDIEGRSVFCDTSTGVIRPYLPLPLRRMAFDIIHGMAHPSIRASVNRLALKFCWPGLRKNAARWARTCEHCQRSKVHKHNRTIIGDFSTPDNRFEHVHVDIVKLPLAKGFQYCLTVIDRFSRWPVAVPLRDMQAQTVAEAFFSAWISNFGTPLTITSDQGTQFESAIFTALARIVGAKRTHTTPYHPQSNGMVERFHRTLKAALMCSSHVPWPDLLPSVLLGLRVAFKEDLQASPAEMLFGVALRIPGEFFISDSLQAEPREFLSSFQRLIRSVRPVPAAHHIERHPFRFDRLQSCSHVFKRVDTIRRPLEPPYTGPHEVVKRLSDKVYVIRVNGQNKTVSTDGLKPAFLELGDSESAAETTTGDTSTRPTVSPNRVSFPSSDTKLSGGGVDVAVEPRAPEGSRRCTRGRSFN